MVSSAAAVGWAEPRDTVQRPMEHCTEGQRKLYQGPKGHCKEGLGTIYQGPKRHCTEGNCIKSLRDTVPRA